MEPLPIRTIEEFLELSNTNLGLSDWLTIDQPRIDQFAACTLDNQWIHVDGSRALHETELGKTIAHGYLTISLIPYFLNQLIQPIGFARIVNYGIRNLTFRNMVPVDSRVRLGATIEKVRDLGEACQVNYQCILEIENQATPAFDGLITFIYYT